MPDTSKSDVSTSLKKETISSDITITYLPIELLVPILGFCDLYDRCEARLVCKRFNVASKLVPYISLREVTYRLNKGDLLRNVDLAKLDSDDPDQLKALIDVLNSPTVKEFITENKIDKVACGQFALLFAASRDLFRADDLCALPLDMITIAVSDVMHEQYHNEKLLNKATIMEYFPYDLFRTITSKVQDRECFALAMGTFNIPVAKKCLKHLYDTIDKLPKIEQAEMHSYVCSILSKHTDATFSMIFSPSNEENDEHFEIYSEDFHEDHDLRRTICDAYFHDAIDMKQWYNQLIAWLILEEEPDVYDDLAEDPDMDPTLFNYFPLHQILRSANEDLILKFLQHPKVDPTARTNEALITASVNGATKVLKHLLNDPRIDPSANDNHALKLVALRGEFETFKLLLEQERVLATADFAQVLEHATTDGGVEMLQYIKEHPRFDLKGNGYKAFLNAVKCGNLAGVKFFVKQLGMDPSVNDGEVLYHAIQNHRVSIVEYLLKDRRVNPTCRNNFAFRTAFANVYDGADLYSSFYKLAYARNAEILAQELCIGNAKSAYISIGGMLLKDQRVLDKLKKTFPQRKDYGLRGSVFAEFLPK